MPDAGPLLEVVRARGGIRLVLGLNQPGWSDAPNGKRRGDRDVERHISSYYRMVKSGRVTVWTADRFCVHVLGTLPELVYGDEFFAGCEEKVAA